MKDKISKGALLDTRPRKLFFAQAAFTSAFTYLTSGVFLSGLALYMGAGDTLGSYLSVILNICGVLILAFTSVIQRIKNRKKLAIALTILSRAATVLIVLIPLLLPAPAKLIVFTAAVVVAFTLQAQTTVVINQWLNDIADDKKKGRYISLRQTLTLCVTVALSLVSGFFMDSLQGSYLGFAGLFAFAGVMAAVEVALLCFVPAESRAEQQPQAKLPFRESVKLPFKNRGFLGFTIYIFAFYTVLYISDSFTNLFMLKYLALPYSTVTMLSLIMSLPQLVLLGVWGRISDKKSPELVLKISIWLFVTETFFMFFAAPGTWFVFIPLAFSFSSVANAGFIVSVFHRRYELMPKENRIVYDNFYTAAIGLGFILGPLIGGALKNLFDSLPVFSAMPLAGVRLLYAVATLGLLTLQIVYTAVRRHKKTQALSASA